MSAYDYYRAAERSLHSRRERDRLFGADRDGFGEPAWDMLLRLFIESNARASIPKAELALEAGKHSDITGPYLTWMASRLLATFDGDEVSLTHRGRLLMLAYLERDRSNAAASG